MLDLPLSAMPGPEAPTPSGEKEVPGPFDFAGRLEALNAERREGEDEHGFGERQRVIIESAARTNPREAARTILERPELVMVGNWWLINVQSLFRLWGETDLPGMADWVAKHPLPPKLQPTADYALFQHRVAGLGEGEAMVLWRSLPDATRHWAKRDLAYIIARSEPGTALERLARLFPAGERGEMMSLAVDVVAPNHPRTLLPWLEDLAPFFYNEPSASRALFRLPAAEVEAAVLALTSEARAPVVLEYMRRCLSEEAPERARKLVASVAVEPYQSLIEKEWTAAMEKARGSKE
jgi:hypothetical protein